MLETHPCAAEGCTEACPVSHLMCVDHWRMVPTPLRREVWRTYREYIRLLRRGDYQSAGICGQDLRTWQARAVAAVRDKQLLKRRRIEELQKPLGL